MRILCCVFLLCWYIRSGYCEGYTNSNKIIDAYYWKDFSGYIPKDALEAGFEDGKPTYIAQVLFDKLLVSGRIIGSDNKAYFEWGVSQRDSSINIKIFCTNHKEGFAWVKTTSADFKTNTDKNFVVGGYEPGQESYIARTTINGEVVVGKLQVGTGVVLHTAKGGQTQRSSTFEALYYDSNLKGAQVDVQSEVTCECKNSTIIKFNYYC